MKLEQVSAIAKVHQIHPGKHSKAELIRMIQADEGNFDCFATAYEGACDQLGCIWREDCFETAKKGALS